VAAQRLKQIHVQFYLKHNLF